MIADIDQTLIGAEGVALPACINPGASAVGIARAVAIAQGIEHEGTAVLELEGKPVPSLLHRAQRPAAPFAIETGESVAVQRETVADEFAAYRDSRDGVVVGGRSQLRGPAAQAVIAIQDRLAQGADIESQLITLAPGMQGRTQLPVVQPNMKRLGLCAGQAESPARILICELERAARHVGDGELCFFLLLC